MLSDNQTLTDFIRKAFPEASSNFLFAAITKHEAIVGKKVVLFFNAAVVAGVQNQIKEFLQRFPEVGEVSFSQAGNIVLTDLLLLREIKFHQPVSYDALFEGLQSLKIVFEEADLKRMLDKLRKAAMIIRSQRGLFCVTEEALGSIPHGNYHNSSDVKRLLELGRRKW